MPCGSNTSHDKRRSVHLRGVQQHPTGHVSTLRTLATIILALNAGVSLGPHFRGVHTRAHQRISNHALSSVSGRPSRGSYLPFKDAREYARTLKLRGRRGWEEWANSGERPSHIPNLPHFVYERDGWVDWDDWLKPGIWLDFEDARAYAQSLELRGKRGWAEWCSSGERPHDIPARPDRVYRKRGWLGWVDWLNYSRVARKPFEDARRYVRTLNLTSHRDWVEWCKSSNRPSDIPAGPDVSYQHQGWVSWPDWLGYHEGKPRRGQFLAFNDTLQYVRSLNLSTWTDWNEWCKSGKRPVEIPSHPDIVYKLEGWISWRHFFGKRLDIFLPFEDAREYVRAQNWTSRKEWREWSKRGDRPEFIPSTPDRMYKFDGWISWSDWLGYRPIRGFEQARMCSRALRFRTREEWDEWCKSGERPIDIPPHPQEVYSVAWVGWVDWLGEGYLKTLMWSDINLPPNALTEN